jgi:hypothetical protein
MIIGPALDGQPDGARRYRVLWIEAQLLVSLLANMGRADRRFTTAGMPADARVIGHVFESFVSARNQQRIGVLIESGTFEAVHTGASFPELDLRLTETIG